MDVLTLENYFKALTSKRRLKLLLIILCTGEILIEELIEKVKLPYKTVIRNLSVLRSAGFIEARIDNSNVYFKVSENITEQEEYLLTLIGLARSLSL